MGSIFLWLLIGFEEWEYHKKLRGDKREFRVFVFLVPSLLGSSLAKNMFIYLRPQLLLGSPFSLAPTLFTYGCFAFPRSYPYSLGLSSLQLLLLSVPPIFLLQSCLSHRCSVNCNSGILFKEKETMWLLPYLIKVRLLR